MKTCICGVLLWGLFSVAGPDTVHATEPERVVVLHTVHDEAMVRLAAELSALGYTAVMVPHPAQALWADQVRDLLKEYDASALINATSLKNRSNVWVVSPGSRDLQLTVDTVKSPPGAADASEVILKTVETLRAGLMRLEQWERGEASADRRTPRLADGAAAEQSEGKAEQTERAANASRRYPRGSIASAGAWVGVQAPAGRLILLLGPAVTYGFADFPVEWQLLVTARVRFGNYLALTLSGFAPTAAMSYGNDYGTAQVWNGSVLLGLQTALRPYDKAWVPWVEASVGPHFSRMKGRGVDPYPDGDDRFVVLELLFRVGMRLRISHRVALELGLHAGDCLPQPLIRVGEERAAFSRPLFGGDVQLSVEIF